MTLQKCLESFTLEAGADLSASQFLFVDADTTAAGSKAVLQTTSGGKVVGVLQNKPTAGQAAEVAYSGVAKVVVGSAGVTAGDSVMADTASKATTATTGKRIVGRALATGVSGDLVQVLIQPGHNVA